MAGVADFNALDREALDKALTSTPDEVARFVRAAAEAGVAEAQVTLGQMLLDGRGVGRSPVDALRWFARAAQLGHVMAMNMVGRCYENGWGIAPDDARAADWYRAAADRGLDWGIYNLATLLTLGRGVAEDRAAALALFRRAGALGHAKSINMIGSFHEDGWVVERDMAVAAEHYARAAEGGDFRGQFNHARMLIEAGRIDDAVAWLRRLPASATPASWPRSAPGWAAGRKSRCGNAEPGCRHCTIDAAFGRGHMSPRRRWISAGPFGRTALARADDSYRAPQGSKEESCARRFAICTGP